MNGARNREALEGDSPVKVTVKKIYMHTCTQQDVISSYSVVSVPPRLPSYFLCWHLAFVGRMLNVVRSLSPVLAILLPMVEVTATAVISVEAGGGKAESMCEGLCQQIPSPVECKAFTRALPRPKLGRTCEQKFGEGWAFACSFLCSR